MEIYNTKFLTQHHFEGINGKISSHYFQIVIVLTVLNGGIDGYLHRTVDYSTCNLFYFLQTINLTWINLKNISPIGEFQ